MHVIDYYEDDDFAKNEILHEKRNPDSKNISKINDASNM